MAFSYDEEEDSRPKKRKKINLCDWCGHVPQSVPVNKMRTCDYHREQFFYDRPEPKEKTKR